MPGEGDRPARRKAPGIGGLELSPCVSSSAATWTGRLVQASFPAIKYLQVQQKIEDRYKRLHENPVRVYLRMGMSGRVGRNLGGN